VTLLSDAVDFPGCPSRYDLDAHRAMTQSAITHERAYPSIFLDDCWAHQKYFGWRLVEDRPGCACYKGSGSLSREA